MTISRPIIIGLLGFIVGAALCVLLFLWADVDNWALIIGPLVGVAAASYAAYLTAARDGSGPATRD